MHRSVEALVIYINHHGCGLRFDSLDRGALRLLQAMIRPGARAVAV
jgi:hypothetical protein